MTKHIENLTQNYFNSFSNKNIVELDKMFDDNIHLIDWEVNLTGKEKVLEFNRTLFDNVKHIQLEVVSIVTSSTTVYAELALLVDDVSLKVLDVITFNDDKIVKLNAYQMKDAPSEVLWEKKLAEYRKQDPFIYR